VFLSTCWSESSLGQCSRFSLSMVEFGVGQIVHSLDSYMPFQAVLINPLNAELNPIFYLLALLGAHHFLHVSRIRVKLLTLR